MTKAKNAYPEIEDLREDLDSLKSNVVELTRHIKKDGRKQTREIKHVVTEGLESLRENGEVYLHDAEKMVKQKPMQSLAIAFAAGMIGNILLSHRG